MEAVNKRQALKTLINKTSKIALVKKLQLFKFLKIAQLKKF